ncbi:ribonuclease H [Paenibacillus sp. 1011MAR3C5]|uniref:ribonuclease H n=1 Tax=Paenibacillus sp. 1011MAR3C5 TaxID=1675787 RepID=UPI000E6BC21F|nr:ribonuclease H family protein [Paenibacillus sp. 1011MAR3C5]RJE83873.1 ribonuclease H [Paenibacillus sp. 1011MAR3C5]
MAKQKVYVVWAGHKPGIYTTWAECQEQTNHFTDAKYKSFGSREEAEQAYRDGWRLHWGQKSTDKPVKKKPVLIAPDAVEDIDWDSISVDVGCSGNPGIVEYKGVHTQTGEILFYHGPIAKGTNNIGEFIAIVHGLAYLKQKGSKQTVYSDSKTALSWLKKKSISSSLVRDDSTKEIWLLADRAIRWLQSNTYDNKVLKWNTEVWGEIKADFGRK